MGHTDAFTSGAPGSRCCGRPNHLPNLSVPLADRCAPSIGLAPFARLRSGARRDLVGFSLASPVQLVEPRYFMIAAPGVLLLFAVCLRRVEPAQARRAIIAVFVILWILELASPYKSGDFRGAATLVRGTATQDATVFIASGFQESLQRDWYTDPERQGLSQLRLPSTRCLGTSFHFRSSSTHPHKHWSPSSSLRGWRPTKASSRLLRRTRRMSFGWTNTCGIEAGRAITSVTSISSR